MNELHRVFLQSVRVGGKDIDLTVEEEYAPENPTQLVRFKIVGPNGLQSDSLEGMLRLLEVAPRHLLSDPPADGSESPHSPPSPALGAALNELHQPVDVDRRPPETGPSGIIEDAFDSIGGTSSLGQTGTESPSLAGTTSQPRHVHGVINPPPGIFNETDDDLGDPTLDARDFREHSLRLKKFEKEHPWLWGKDEDGDRAENTGVNVDMQVVWWAEQTKALNPERYAAALDPKKYREYMDKNDYWTGEPPKFEEPEANVEPVCSDAPRCQFIKSDGQPCGSPALKRRRLCHFHSKTTDGRKRRKSKSAHRSDARSPGSTEAKSGDESVGRELPVVEVPVLELPVLEDDLAIQMAVTNICRQLANDSLEPKRASTLLYGLQVASITVRRTALNRRERKT